MKKLIVKFVGTSINALSFISKPYATRKALELFMTPRSGKINEAQATFLNTAQQEKLMTKGHAIMTYHWPGTKQTIILAHGWESNSARWQRLINMLRAYGFNIIAVDAPAHGRSGSTMFNAILYAEFINTVSQRFSPSILIGHSIGGMALAYFLHQYQYEKSNKIVLLGAPSEFKDIMQRYIDLLGYNKRVASGLNQVIQDRFGNSPEYFSTARFLAAIKSEGLIIHDQNDQIIPFKDALHINDHFKNSRLISTKGLGHSLSHASVTKHIYTFIAS